MVEDIPPQSLGSVLDQGAGLSIIERILVASDCEGSSTFSRFIAVRYLGGILDLPSFWLQSGMMLRAVVQKILVRATTLLKDLGVDSVRSDDSMLSVPSDIEGVDILCEVLLVRIQSWLPDRLSSEITCEAWYPSLYHVVQLLRQPKTEDLLPRSWTLATGEEFRELVPSQYQTRVVATLSAISQLSDQVHSLYHEREAPPQKDDLYRRTETKLKVKIRRATSKDRIRQYGKVTYTLLNQPYLQAMATVSLLIMEMIQCVKDTEQAGVKMAERSYQLVCAIINICHDSEADLAPTMIRNIAQFSETLEKILTFVRGQVKGSFWRRILRSMEDADLIAECNAGLKHASDVFGVQSGITAIMPMAEMRKYATQRHEELITILKEKRSRLKRSWTPDWDDSPTSAPRKKLLELLGSPVGLDASSTMLGDGRDQTYLIVL
ncbi:hypothetical protein C8R44DRAFT_807253 [Mycena epipterygia]|nr:hypothetical protein C8R44DRAFT_807253 [Mycena epipterygia]